MSLELLVAPKLGCYPITAPPNWLRGFYIIQNKAIYGRCRCGFLGPCPEQEGTRCHPHLGDGRAASLARDRFWPEADLDARPTKALA